MAHTKFEPFDDPADVVPPASSAQTGDGFVNLEDDPTSRRGQEVVREAARMSIGDIVSESVAPVLKDLIRVVQDEGPRGLVGRRLSGTPYSRRDFAEKMIPKNFTRQQAAAVLDEPNLEAATRAMLRIQDQIARGVRAGQQSPGALLGIMASTMLDIDAPLILMSGSAFGAAKLTRAVLRASQRAGLRPRVATRAASTAVGFSGGAQAGVVIGTGDQLARDTAEWGDLAAMLLLTTAAGTALGGAFPGLNRRLAQEQADAEFLKRIVRDEKSAVDNLDVETLIQPGDHVPDIGGDGASTLDRKRRIVKANRARAERAAEQKQEQGPVILEADDLPPLETGGSPTPPETRPDVLDTPVVLSRLEFMTDVGGSSPPRDKTPLSPEHDNIVKDYTTETTPQTGAAVAAILDDAGSPLLADTTVFRSYDPKLGVSGKHVTSTFHNANAATATADTVQHFTPEGREVAVIRLTKGTRVLDAGAETIIKEDLVPTGKVWDVVDHMGRDSILHVEYRQKGGGDGKAIIGGDGTPPKAPATPTKGKGPISLEGDDLPALVTFTTRLKGIARKTQVKGKPANEPGSLFQEVIDGSEGMVILQKQINKLDTMKANQTGPKARASLENKLIALRAQQDALQEATIVKLDDLEKAQDNFIAEMQAKTVRNNERLIADDLDLGGMEPTPEVREIYNARDAHLEAESLADQQRMRLLGLDEADVAAGRTILGGEPPQSLGAAATGTGGRPRRVLEDPAGPIGEAEAKFMDTSDEWVHQTDFLQTRDQVATEWWARVATNQLGGFSTHNFHDLWKGQARVGNWIGGVIFESPSGLNRGRATSSALMEMYHRRIMARIGGDFQNFSYAWAKEQGMTWRNTGRHISKDGKRAWSRELYLEMNDRALGKKSKRSEHIRGAADRLEASGSVGLEVLRGRKGQRAVDGFEDPSLGGVRDRKGYVPYRIDGFRINELLRGGVKMKDIEAAFANGYRKAGLDTGKDAEAVAKALIARARSNDFHFDTSMDTLLSGDGRQFLKESLHNSGMSEVEIKSLMQRLMGEQAELGKESFAKRRNELDMNIEIKNDTGQTIQLVDLFDQDIDRIWQRYARQASGSAALARMGITNRAARTTVISALQAEQRALGELVTPTGLMEAMFSHFDAGPVWGFDGGVINKGIGRVAATAKRLTNIGLLEMLGITQLGELGAIIAMQGTESFYRRGIQPWFDAALRAKDKQLLNDMAYVTGEIGLDHKYYAEWLDLDDVGKQATATLNERIAQNISDYTSNATFVQNYLNLFNTVRAGQQKLAMMGMVDKVFRELKKGNIEGFAQRAERDLGLNIDDLEILRDLMDDPKMVQWDETGTFINRVFFENWDPDFADVFGSSLTRNMNQVVQKSMAGEQDAWMHTGWGSIMTHLLTFPLAAFQKQFLRNAQHMDLQAFAAMSQGMLTATIAVHIRDVATGREDTTANRVKRGFNYNNLSSWMPMVWDPIVTIMGQDDWRFNQFGPTADLTPVVFTQLDDLRRAPGAIINGLTGADDFDYFDRQAVKAIPFAGTMFLSQAFNKREKTRVPEPAKGVSPPDTNAQFNGLSPRSLGDVLKHPGVQAAIETANR